MKRILFILAVLAIFFGTVVLLYPRTDGQWTGYVSTAQGRFVADSSHRTLDECRRYVGTHSGGLCGLECAVGRNCKQIVSVPEVQ